MILDIIICFVLCSISFSVGYYIRSRLEFYNRHEALIEDDSKRGEVVRVFDPNEQGLPEKGYQIAAFSMGNARNLLYTLEHYGVKVRLAVVGEKT